MKFKDKMEKLNFSRYYFRERWGEIKGICCNEHPELTGVSRGWEFKGYQLIVNGGENFIKGKIVAVFEDTDTGDIISDSFTSEESLNEFLKLNSEVEILDKKSYYFFEGEKTISNPNFDRLLKEINDKYRAEKFK